MKKTGLFFGSFNPVHIGHMAIANYLVEFTEIEQIWFVVSPQNPHKENSTLLPESQRLAMVERAIGNDSRFKACDVEFTMPKPSYTIDTLNLLEQHYPDCCFYPIIGSDNYASLSLWKDFLNMISRFTFLVYPRPGSSNEAEYPGGHFIKVDAPLIEVSSSFIRQALSQGHDIRHFLPEGVFQMIKTMDFSEL